MEKSSQTGSTKMALYSLTGNVRSPLHAEPAHAYVLQEASTVMVRTCMLKILQDKLLETFSDKTKMETLF